MWKYLFIFAICVGFASASIIDTAYRFIIPTSCGDSQCTLGESCASCPDDCGQCPTGGGGGGKLTIAECKEGIIAAYCRCGGSVRSSGYCHDGAYYEDYGKTTIIADEQTQDNISIVIGQITEDGSLSILIINNTRLVKYLDATITISNGTTTYGPYALQFAEDEYLSHFPSLPEGDYQVTAKIVYGDTVIFKTKWIRIENALRPQQESPTGSTIGIDIDLTTSIFSIIGIIFFALISLHLLRIFNKWS